MPEMDPSVLITPEEQALRAAMMGLKPPMLDPNNVQSAPVAAPNIQPSQGLAPSTLPSLGAPPAPLSLGPASPGGFPDPRDPTYNPPARTGVKARLAEIGLGIMGGLGGGGLMGGLRTAENYQNAPSIEGHKQYLEDRQHMMDEEGAAGKETDQTRLDIARIAAGSRESDPTRLALADKAAQSKKDASDATRETTLRKLGLDAEGNPIPEDQLAPGEKEQIALTRSREGLTEAQAANVPAALAEKTANDEAHVQVLRTKATQAANKAKDPGADAFERTIGVNAGKDVEKAQGADFRTRSMDSSYPKAVKGDQQAQLNLLTNHLGMTMGLQPNARITQAILNEAIKSQPWLKSMEAKFDSRGYLSGVTLGKEQMDQMMGLAKTQRLNAWQQAADSADQAGVKGRVKFPSDVPTGTSGAASTPGAATGAQPPGPPAAGMKWQQSSKTGQFRQVPNI